MNALWGRRGGVGAGSLHAYAEYPPLLCCGPSPWAVLAWGAALQLRWLGLVACLRARLQPV